MRRLNYQIAISGLSLVGLLSLLAGCAGDSAYMPLKNGQSWRYFAHEETGSRIRNIKVGKRCPVGNHQGFELTGDGGTSKMAWVDGELWVAEFASMRFDPPLVLLKPGTPTAKWSHSGIGTSRVFQQQFNAQLIQEPAKLEVLGQKRNTLLVTLKMEFQGKQITLESWFQKGLGIVKQEQRVGGIKVFALEWVGGS